MTRSRPTPGAAGARDSADASNGFKLREGRFRRDTRQKFFTVRGVKPWRRLPREAAEAPSLETFQARLDGSLRGLVWGKGSPLTAGGWARWPPQVPSHPEPSVMHPTTAAPTAEPATLPSSAARSARSQRPNKTSARQAGVPAERPLPQRLTLRMGWSCSRPATALSIIPSTVVRT